MTKYDPRLALERETELRANAEGLWCADSMWRAAEQMESMRAEIGRLRAETERLADEDTERYRLGSEVKRMRPVVEAAERYRDNGPTYAGICQAVDAYRAARDKAGG